MTDTSMTPDRERLRAAFVAALDIAHKTEPCSCGSTIWSSCYHPDRPGRSHSERRADAVLVVRDAEVDRLRARVAELEAAAGTARAMHRQYPDSEHCQYDDMTWPCPTVTALGPVDEAADLAEGLADLDVMRREHPAPCRVPDSPDCTCPAESTLAATDSPGDSEADATPVCRCDEPDADPYACEADNCTAEFSELNPFGSGARPVTVASAEVSRKCGTCGWKTSVWHVDDGSAEEELYRHVARVHGGTP